jgi:hypothetical protein
VLKRRKKEGVRSEIEVAALTETERTLLQDLGDRLRRYRPIAIPDTGNVDDALDDTICTLSWLTSSPRGTWGLGE